MAHLSIDNYGDLKIKVVPYYEDTEAIWIDTETLIELYTKAGYTVTITKIETKED